MSFMDEFDKRASRKPGDPVPEDENPENRELLEFSDLIRERQALPASNERQRVLDRVRAAQKPPARPAGGSCFPTMSWTMFSAQSHS